MFTESAWKVLPKRANVKMAERQNERKIMNLIEKLYSNYARNYLIVIAVMACLKLNKTNFASQ